LWYEREVARRRSRDEQDRDLVMAWQVERIHVMTENKKQLPDLKQLLRRGKPQTAQEQVAILASLGLKGHGRLNVLVRGENHA
jgi:hypothetical protein